MCVREGKDPEGVESGRSDSLNGMPAGCAYIPRQLVKFHMHCFYDSFYPTLLMVRLGCMAASGYYSNALWLGRHRLLCQRLFHVIKLLMRFYNAC